MEWFGKDKEEEKEQALEESDIVKSMKGMTEKQLLRLLVLIQDDAAYGSDYEYDQMVEMAKREQ